MTGKDKNNGTDLSGFLHYRGKELPGNERNAFERELQKDPFAAEAAEGFEELSPEVIKNDLRTLTNRLRSETGIKKKIIFYRIAASVAVLMIISSIFIITRLDKPEILISGNVTKDPLFDIAKPFAYAEPEIKKENKFAVNELNREKEKISKVPAGAEFKNNMIDDKAAEEQKMATAGNQAKGVISVPERAVEMKTIAAEPSRAMAKADLSRMDAEVPILIKGKVISSEDNLPIPGAIINIKGTTLGTQTDADGIFNITLPDRKNYSLIASFIGMDSKEIPAKGDSMVHIQLTASQLALDEVIVVGYGVKRKSEKDMTGAISTINLDKAAEKVYTPPTPVNGKESFDKYIEDNIRKPADYLTGKSQVVVLSFIVKTNGIPDSIRIIRSPGKSFSEEAIRLIKEGPAWIPAIENKIKIEEEVRIRVVFK